MPRLNHDAATPNAIRRVTLIALRSTWSRENAPYLIFHLRSRQQSADLSIYNKSDFDRGAPRWKGFSSDPVWRLLQDQSLPQVVLCSKMFPRTSWCKAIRPEWFQQSIAKLQAYLSQFLVRLEPWQLFTVSINEPRQLKRSCQARNENVRLRRKAEQPAEIKAVGPTGDRLLVAG